jgi:hypothetical protein
LFHQATDDSVAEPITLPPGAVTVTCTTIAMGGGQTTETFHLHVETANTNALLEAVDNMQERYEHLSGKEAADDFVSTALSAADAVITTSTSLSARNAAEEMVTTLIDGAAAIVKKVLDQPTANSLLKGVLTVVNSANAAAAASVMTANTAAKTAGILVRLVTFVAPSKDVFETLGNVATALVASITIQQKIARGAAAESGRSIVEQHQAAKAAAAAQKESVLNLGQALNWFNSKLAQNLEDGEVLVKVAPDSSFVSVAGRVGRTNSRRRFRRGDGGVSTEVLDIIAGLYVFEIDSNWLDTEMAVVSQLDECTKPINKSNVTDPTSRANTTNATCKARVDSFSAIEYGNNIFSSFANNNPASGVASLVLYGAGAEIPIKNMTSCLAIKIAENKGAATTRAGTIARTKYYTAVDANDPISFTIERADNDPNQVFHLIIEPYYPAGIKERQKVNASGLLVNINVASVEHEQSEWYTLLPEPVRTISESSSDGGDRRVADASHVLHMVSQALANNTPCIAKSTTVVWDQSKQGGSTIHINVTATGGIPVMFGVRSFDASCVYFDVADQTWKGDGCVTAATSTPENMVCKCNHLTTFGSKSGIVRPNLVKIEAITAEDIATNPVVFAVIILIWFIFLLVVRNARKSDERCALARGPVVLQGYSGSHGECYRIVVKTGVRPNAGLGPETRVYIRLKGTHGETTAIELDHPWRPLFMRNSTDVFLVTTPFDLGNIKEVSLSHDGNAAGHTLASWFVSHVRVQNERQHERSILLV